MDPEPSLRIGSIQQFFLLFSTANAIVLSSRLSQIALRLRDMPVSAFVVLSQIVYLCHLSILSTIIQDQNKTNFPTVYRKWSFSLPWLVSEAIFGILPKSTQNDPSPHILDSDPGKHTTQEWYFCSLPPFLSSWLWCWWAMPMLPAKV